MFGKKDPRLSKKAIKAAVPTHKKVKRFGLGKKLLTGTVLAAVDVSAPVRIAATTIGMGGKKKVKLTRKEKKAEYKRIEKEVKQTIKAEKKMAQKAAKKEKRRG